MEKILVGFIIVIVVVLLLLQFKQPAAEIKVLTSKTCSMPASKHTPKRISEDTLAGILNVKS